MQAFTLQWFEQLFNRSKHLGSMLSHSDATAQYFSIDPKLINTAVVARSDTKV